MPRKLGEQPLTNAEKQVRQRERVKRRLARLEANMARLEAAEDAVQFVLALRPDSVPVDELAALQQRLEALR